MHVHVHVHAYIHSVPEQVVDSILQGDFYVMFEISIDGTSPTMHLAFRVQCTSMYHCTLESVCPVPYVHMTIQAPSIFLSAELKCSFRR